ncbi:AbrB/MazE/SpoVT family DNA-binding domain-containing protein [uncultured Methylobacterium sp.]|jgi:antitoxin VapB|uniref:antitoxin n=1 Tax=uncultured Methylobacterium sp. TaxID=157278 RepID=UPI0026039F93|nr:AbrB/MazE/SpoVT family DNA-binding domain-containing protein [uncultured Methylobacterium sp.]
MAIAKVIALEGAQAIRLPPEFRFGGSEVEVFRRGREIVLRERTGGLASALDAIADLPDDFLIEREDVPPQRREEL